MIAALRPAPPKESPHRSMSTPSDEPSSRHDTITREEVAHLARLARLAVTDEELDVFAGQLEIILEAVARVGDAAVEDVAPTTHAVPMTNVMRPDVARPSLPRDAVLAAAPAAEEDRFRVPRILGEEA